MTPRRGSNARTGSAPVERVELGPASRPTGRGDLHARAGDRAGRTIDAGTVASPIGRATTEPSAGIPRPLGRAGRSGATGGRSHGSAPRRDAPSARGRRGPSAPPAAGRCSEMRTPGNASRSSETARGPRRERRAWGRRSRAGWGRRRAGAGSPNARVWVTDRRQARSSPRAPGRSEPRPSASGTKKSRRVHARTVRFCITPTVPIACSLRGIGEAAILSAYLVIRQALSRSCAHHMGNATRNLSVPV